MITLTWVVNDLAEEGLSSEHGFSMWITTEEGQVLFDTGGTGAVLMGNLAALGLDPGALDAIVLSHAHDDHTGGLPALLDRLPSEIPLYAHPTIFRPRYSRKTGELVDRGMSMARAELSERVSLRLVEQPVEVLPGVWTTGEIRTREKPQGSSRHHLIPQGGSYVQDPYTDDLSLVLSTGDDRRFLLCGCCHAGLLNTLYQVQQTMVGEVVGIAGGVHLVNASAETIERTLEVLTELPDLRALWVGHCSGDAFIEAAQRSLKSITVRRGAAGQQLVLDSPPSGLEVSCG
ncbi:MAG: MBL fold metallo-hydrolase [Anaerolineae bacterium]